MKRSIAAAGAAPRRGARRQRVRAHATDKKSRQAVAGWCRRFRPRRRRPCAGASACREAARRRPTARRRSRDARYRYGSRREDRSAPLFRWRPPENWNSASPSVRPRKSRARTMPWAGAEFIGPQNFDRQAPGSVVRSGERARARECRLPPRSADRPRSDSRPRQDCRCRPDRRRPRARSRRRPARNARAGRAVGGSRCDPAYAASGFRSRKTSRASPGRNSDNSFGGAPVASTATPRLSASARPDDRFGRVACARSSSPRLASRNR